MSTALIIRSSELPDADIFGFTRLTLDTVWKIYYQDGLGVDLIYTDNEENGLFPEDFSNKRAYSAFLKENKKRYSSFGYRITKGQLQEIFSKLKKDFLLHISSADDLETFQHNSKIKISYLDINEKTIFKENIIYEVCRRERM